MTALSTPVEQLELVYLLEQEDLNQTGQELLAGLGRSPKTISPRYFYDEKGSELFEQICELPEYYPTRTEAEILKTVSPEIAELTGNAELIELGSGSSTKTRFLLDAYQKFDQVSYVPVDVSVDVKDVVDGVVVIVVVVVLVGCSRSCDVAVAVAAMNLVAILLWLLLT